MNLHNLSYFVIAKLCILLFGLQVVMAYSLPLDHVSDPWCEKGTHRNELANNCKVNFELPTISVGSYEENSREKLMYSVLWKDSYAKPHIQEGGHPGLDIVSAEGTPVYSMTSGEVIKSGYNSGYGNVIVIRAADGTDYHFNYAHLEKRLVEKGDTIQEGQHIGTVGKTGFTIGRRGYHLELQITKPNSPSHPYAYHDCELASYMDAVDTGICNKLLETYTVDPMKWMQENLKNHGYHPGHEEHTWKKELLEITHMKKRQDITITEENNNYNDVLAEEVIIPLLKQRKEKETQQQELTQDIHQDKNASDTHIGIQDDTQTYIYDIDTKSYINEDIQKEDTTPTKITETHEEITKEETIPHQTVPKTKVDTVTSGRTVINGAHISREIVASTRSGYMDLIFTITDSSGTPITGALATPLDISIDKGIYSSYISQIRSVRNGKKVVKLKVL